jgi:hypothetical protein
MTRIAPATLALFCLALPAPAQDSGSGTLEDLGRKADRALEGLMRKLVPEIEALKDQLRELDQYEAPEMLPNGDIIIRRKHAPDPDAPPGGETPRSRPRAPQSPDTET